jgi:hypothetical protein
MVVNIQNQHKSCGRQHPHVEEGRKQPCFSNKYLGTFLSTSTFFYFMPPKKKGGVSRKVRIAGPYSCPEAVSDVEDSAVPPTLPTNHLLSLTQVAAAREAANAKYIAQLRSAYLILLIP